jgi:hypothetical protein
LKFIFSAGITASIVSIRAKRRKQGLAISTASKEKRGSLSLVLGLQYKGCMQAIKKMDA